MLTWKEIVQNYIVKHSDRIKKTTSPLRDHFGINYFTYHRIDNEGKYTVLVDRPDYAEHYVNEKFFLHDPYLGQPQTYQAGLSFAEKYESAEFKKTIIEAGKEFLNSDNMVMLIEQRENGVEFFGFAANSKKSALSQVCLNHPQLLKSFAVHFKHELKGILNQMSAEANSLLELKGENYFCTKPIHPEIKEMSRMAYLEDLGLKEEVEKAQRLSRRERECLKLLIEGKSAKETAVRLGLSRRTVESYFENIKDKCSCWCKQELFDLSKKLDQLGLLP